MIDIKFDHQAIRPGYDINNPPTFTKSMLAPLQGLDTFRFMDWGGNYIIIENLIS